MAEDKDITIAIFTGSIAIIGLLLVLMGFLLSSYRGLDDVTRKAGRNDYKTGITFALIAIVISSLVTLCSLFQLIGIFDLFALIAAVFIILIIWLVVVATATYRLFMRSMWPSEYNRLVPQLNQTNFYLMPHTQIDMPTKDGVSFTVRVGLILKCY